MILLTWKKLLHEQRGTSTLSMGMLTKADVGDHKILCQSGNGFCYKRSQQNSHVHSDGHYGVLSKACSVSYNIVAAIGAAALAAHAPTVISILG